VRPVVGLSTGAGRLVAAAELTVQDAFEQLDPGIFRLEGLLAAGGLRGGSYRATPRGLVLRRDTFVPGVAVSGLVPAHGTAQLRLSGRTRATLTFTEPGAVSVRTATGVAHGSARLVRATVSQQLSAIRRLRFARP
jgi:hypothetical protein